MTSWRLALQQLGQLRDDISTMSRRVKLCQQALEFLHRAENERLWAQLQDELGKSLQQDPLGHHMENAERAIDAYQQALTIRTKSGMPVEWSRTMTNLAIAYQKRLRGNRAENIERAIDFYQQALTVSTETAMPLQWALTLTNLANAYAERLRGNRAENIERAIDFYQQALTVRTETAMPLQWAATMTNLALVYTIRIRGERAENIEKAIAAYKQILSIQTKTTRPVDWADTIKNLATAYLDRIRGDSAGNIEQAIDFYQQALTVRTETAMPLQWALTLIDLASAYLDRIRGDRANNIKQALVAYQQALTVVTLNDMPVVWAQTMMNLATAYHSSLWGDRANNIEHAIAAYQQALTILTKIDMPIDWATTMSNMAAAYLERMRDNRANNIERAIDFYQQALIVRTKSDMPVVWALTLTNLAIAYQKRLRGNRAENIERALNFYQQALTVFTRLKFPIKYRYTLSNIVDLYIGEMLWEKAYQTSLDAIEVGEEIFAAAYTDAGRQSAMGETGQLYVKLSYSSLHLGRFGEALSKLEAGKARVLAETLSLGEANLTQLDTNEHNRLQLLREIVRGLEYEFRLPSGHPSRRNEHIISDNIRDTRATLLDLIRSFRVKYPDFMPIGLHIADLLEVIPVGGALVAPLFTLHGSAVFVIPFGAQEVTAEHVIHLDEFTLLHLNELAFEKVDERGWLRYYFDFLTVQSDQTKSKDEKSRALGSLFDGIEDVTCRLWDAFVGHIHARLELLGIENGRRILLMSQGDANLLPLHAAWREVNGIRRYFMDDYTITYTPSMFAYANAFNRQKMGNGTLVAGVREYSNWRDLPSARDEAESIAALFGEQPLLDGNASVEAVKEGAVGKKYVHLSCHGGFGWGSDVFASALYLGNDEVLYLSEIMAKLDIGTSRLVTLSACETGIVDYSHAPDEVVGLPAGFMQAGAAAVVSSLWSVDDRSTSLLMGRMYKNMIDKDKQFEPAQALREAQFWLRDVTAKEIGEYYQAYVVSRMTEKEANDAYFKVIKLGPNARPYAHPYYWAAFIYTGL